MAPALSMRPKVGMVGYRYREYLSCRRRRPIFVPANKLATLLAGCMRVPIAGEYLRLVFGIRRYSARSYRQQLDS